MQQVYPERLSLGTSRRVALARAFVIRPDLLLMDESFVSLDAPTARRIRNLLADVWMERPHTVPFVIHDVQEAIILADRLIFLSPAPARVVDEVQAAIPRHARNHEDLVEEFRQKLLSEHPLIKQLLCMILANWWFDTTWCRPGRIRYGSLIGSKRSGSTEQPGPEVAADEFPRLVAY